MGLSRPARMGTSSTFEIRPADPDQERSCQGPAGLKDTREEAAEKHSIIRI